MSVVVAECGESQHALELKKYASTILGDMDRAGYSQFVDTMYKVANSFGISEPLLGLSIKTKEGSCYLREVNKEEWTQVQKDAWELHQYMPQVLLIDGSKFTWAFYRFSKTYM